MALFGFITVANAQFPESFETAVLLDGPRSKQMISEQIMIGQLQQLQTAVHKPPMCVSVTGGLAEDWLVTPQFTPDASSSCSVHAKTILHI